jgi:predicted RNA methylase
VLDEVFIHKAYNPRGFEIEEGGVVVDLGAHIGAFTVFAARKAGVVLSYEPESRT